MAQVASGRWRVAGSKRAGLLDCLHLVQIAESRLQLFGRLSSRQDSSLLNIASLRRVALRAYYLLLTAYHLLLTAYCLKLTAHYFYSLLLTSFGSLGFATYILLLTT